MPEPFSGEEAEKQEDEEGKEDDYVDRIFLIWLTISSDATKFIFPHFIPYAFVSTSTCFGT